MRTMLLAILIATASTHAAHADDCGQSDVSDDALAEITKAADAEDGGKADSWDSNQPVHVATYLHVVRRAPQGEGDMPVAHARAITLDVINAEFAKQAIPFVLDLAKIDYLDADDATYHLMQYSAEEKQLWNTAQVKGIRNLNIYLVGPNPSTTVTGWGEFMLNPIRLFGDHVVLRYYPAKNGFSDPLVPVHEAGHWFGLLHTFQFGCGTVMHGDLIRDTATQAKAEWTCAPTTDTCPDDPGTDPIDNIMGYSSGCRGTFTPGQIRRMKTLWHLVRGGKTDDGTPAADPTMADAGGCTTTTTHGALAPLTVALLALRRRRRS